MLPFVRSVGVSILLAGIAFGTLTGCAETSEDAPADSSEVRTDTSLHELRERADAYQPYLEAVHRRVLAAQLEASDAPARSENAPRQRIQIHANKAAAWEMAIVGDKEFFINTADTIGEQWFVASEIVKVVDDNGGPYVLTPEEKIVVKYEDRVLVALKTAKKPTVVAAELVNRLEGTDTLFEINTRTLHARTVTVDGKLFVEVNEGSYVPGWYAVGQFDG